MDTSSQNPFFHLCLKQAEGVILDAVVALIGGDLVLRSAIHNDLAGKLNARIDRIQGNRHPDSKMSLADERLCMIAHLEVLLEELRKC